MALFPCNECAKVIIQSGITEVVYMSDKYHDTPAMQASKRLFTMAKVRYICIYVCMLYVCNNVYIPVYLSLYICHYIYHYLTIITLLLLILIFITITLLLLCV